MVERMISDISKWLVIILIFFIAFACSLFLIFSHFAVALKYHDILNPSLNIRQPRITTPIIDDNSTSERNERCPAMFYNLTDASDWSQNKYRYISGSDDIENGTCSASENWSKIKKIGPHPAVFYFGKSFSTTILTTFFTLFGVIAEDNTLVNIEKRTKIFSDYFF